MSSDNANSPEQTEGKYILMMLKQHYPELNIENPVAVIVPKINKMSWEDVMPFNVHKLPPIENIKEKTDKLIAEKNCHTLETEFIYPDGTVTKQIADYEIVGRLGAQSIDQYYKSLDIWCDVINKNPVPDPRWQETEPSILKLK